MFSLAMCGPTIYRTALLEHVRQSRGDVRVSGQSNHAEDAASLIAHVMPDAAIVISGGEFNKAQQTLERIRKVDLDVRIVWWALLPENSQFESLRDSETSLVYWETSAEDIVKAIGFPLQPLLRADSRPRLTQQEHTILQLAADGLSNKAIAYRLAVSESTVKNHLRHIGAKFNTSSRAQAVWQAVQWGYLRSDGSSRQLDVS
jgi:DNA-binding NarL/FixJ family response regulator